MKKALLLLAVTVACSVEVNSQEQGVATTTLDSLRAQFRFSERHATDGTNATLPSRSVIPDAAKVIEAQISLAQSANGAAMIATKGGEMQVAVSLRGASASPSSLASGAALFAKADLHGGHYVQLPIRDGMESFVTFAKSPGSDTVFDFSMTGVAGLRLVENSLELLDTHGTPRLRMAPPVVVDSKGAAVDVSVTVEGCAFDDSPVAPWGRKVIAPGATSCAVHLSWSDATLTYPVLLDPAWTTTGSMVTARRWHGAALLPSMRVLVMGGEGVSSAYVSTAELYDPSTGTWARTRSIDPPRRRFTTTMIDGGKVLIAGGEVLGGRTPSAALYDPSTAIWTTTGPMSTARAYHDAAYVSTLGKVLVAGGMGSAGNVLASAELYNPASGTWSTTGSLATARHSFTLTSLPDRTVLAAGGVDGASNVLTSTEVFSTNVWSPGATMNVARQRHRASLLDDNRVTFTGGFTNAAATTATADAEIYDGILKTFFVQDAIGLPRGDHGAVALQANQVFVVGGSDGVAPNPEAWLHMANLAGSFPASNMVNPVTQATTTLLGTGAVLVAGGWNGANITNAALLSDQHLYAFGRNGARHQIQIISASGDWNTSFAFSFKWDATTVSVTYDWTNGVGNSLRARVYDAIGTLVGTVVTAHRGTSTFTSADGSQQATFDRNRVPIAPLNFLDEKVIVLGPEQTMASMLKKTGWASVVHIPVWFDEWAITARADVFDLAGSGALDNLWSALTDITFDTTGTTCLGYPCKFNVRAWLEGGVGTRIMHTDCSSSTCPDMNGMDPDCAYTGIYPNCDPLVKGQNYNWFWVDVVRKHYTVDHNGYPQFFQHHRWFLDQMETWIKFPGGWEDQHQKTDLLPFGHIPGWNSANPIPSELQATALPGRACPPAGTSGTVDSINTCDWAASATFGGWDFTLAFPFGVCDSSGSAAGDWAWFATGMPGSNTGSCTATSGVSCWHGKVHLGVAGDGQFEAGFGGQGLKGSFATFDAPSSPLFFPWHAYIDTLYADRLDCP